MLNLDVFFLLGLNELNIVTFIPKEKATPTSTTFWERVGVIFYYYYYHYYYYYLRLKLFTVGNNIQRQLVVYCW